MTIRVPPRLQVIAHEYAVEPGVLGFDGVVEELARAELFSRSTGVSNLAAEVTLPAEADAACSGGNDHHPEGDQALAR